MKSDVKGTSQCPPGQEMYEEYTSRLGRRRRRMIQYDYRALDGSLFSTLAPNLETARARREEWLQTQRPED